MNRPLWRQRGVAAIEMAVLLGVGTSLIATTVLLGRLTWHAIVVEKAVQNAARAIAALPVEVVEGADAAEVLTALAVRRVLDTTAAAGLDIQPRSSTIVVECDTYACGAGRPAIISVEANVRFTDTVFGPDFLFRLIGAEDIPIPARATLTYVP